VIEEIIVGCWKIIGGIAACATLPGSVELLGLSLAALLPWRRPASSSASGPWRVVIVVPAHNEERHILSCMESLFHAERADMQVEVYVIADNCTDKTAELARRAGATVLERTDDVERGKGYALRYAFAHLEPLGYDCILVVDADTVVASNFVLAAAGAMRRGATAVQTRYLARNTVENTRARLLGFALRAFNVVRPLGRDKLGLSAGILGNGFGLRRETLEAVPYHAFSVVEDLEYHLALVRSGRRVSFIDETAVLGDMPVRGKGVKTQRARWEGGRLRMLCEKGPGLLGDVLRGRLRCLEPLFELLLLPLAFHVMLLIVAALSPAPLIRDIGLCGLGIVAIHLLVTIVIGEDAWRDFATLANAPVYILWKLLLIPALIHSASAKHLWVRTDRNGDGNGNHDGNDRADT
jgi:hypothetical protein